MSKCMILVAMVMIPSLGAARERGPWQGERETAVQIVASHSGKCLTVANGSRERGATIMQAACRPGDPGQQWYVRPTRSFPQAGSGEALHQIVAAHSDLCLDVEGERTGDGARLVQWSCKPLGPSAANQLWGLRNVGAVLQLVASHSGACVDVAGRSKADGASVVQYRCGPRQDNQLFELRSVEETPKLDPLVGEWRWFGGITVTIDADGTMRGTNREGGTWQRDPGSKHRYVLTWDAGWIDRLVMSSDLQSLSGSNQHGTRVTGERLPANEERRRREHRRHTWREPPAPEPQPEPEPEPVVRDCGTGADDPGCNVARGDAYPADAAVFGAALATLKAELSDLTRRDLCRGLLGKHLLTARQLGLVLDLFRSDNNRLDAARALVKQVVDPDHAAAHTTKFRSSYNRRSYAKLLSGL